jgi:hypothetical protein
MEPVASTSTLQPLASADMDSVMSSETDLEASPEACYAHTGPMCAYGSRLSYTYFSGSPTPEQLAAADPGAYWLNIDNQLVYLSFFQVRGTALKRARMLMFHPRATGYRARMSSFALIRTIPSSRSM